MDEGITEETKRSDYAIAERARQRQVEAGERGEDGKEYGKLGGRGNKNPLSATLHEGGLEETKRKG